MAQVTDPVIERLLEMNTQLRVRAEQLETALQSRIVIEQAKGIIAERYGVSLDRAFEILRRAARNNRIRVHALASRVIDERTTPAEIAEQLA
jgi:AmiR/NasT family two-component response regulator